MKRKLNKLFHWSNFGNKLQFVGLEGRIKRFYRALTYLRHYERCKLEFSWLVDDESAHDRGICVDRPRFFCFGSWPWLKLAWLFGVIPAFSPKIRWTNGTARFLDVKTSVFIYKDVYCCWYFWMLTQHNGIHIQAWLRSTWTERFDWLQI